MFLASLWLGPADAALVHRASSARAPASLLVDQPDDHHAHRGRGCVVTFAIALLIILTSFRRSRLGVAGPRGESMFVDLRDRIANQGDLPALPAEWHVESVAPLRRRHLVRRRLHRGRRAADRTAGADRGRRLRQGRRGRHPVAAALRRVRRSASRRCPATGSCPRPTSTCSRQDWSEGFATAIHLHLDLRTGDFELRKAGHPPAVWLHAGSGPLVGARLRRPGPRPDPGRDFEVVRGTLRPTTRW